MLDNEPDYLDPLNNIENPVENLPDLSTRNHCRKYEDKDSPEESLPSPEEAAEKNPRAVRSFIIAKTYLKIGVVITGGGVLVILFSDYPKAVGSTLVAMGLSFIWCAIDEYRNFKRDS